MLDYLKDILTNLAADLLGWVIVFLFICLFTVSRRIRERRRLLRFLGLSPQKTQLRIYLSSYLLAAGEVVDLAGEPTMWRGLFLSGQEFQIIPSIDRWLSPLAKPSTFFDYLLDYLTPSRFRPAQIQVEYSPSPRSTENLKLNNCTVVLIGGPLHNFATRLYYGENKAYMQSDDWTISVRVTKGRGTGRVMGPNVSRETHMRDEFEHPGIDMVVLEKLWDEERNSMVFIASGTGSNGVKAAMHYLITNWVKLQERHGENPFSICLECPRPYLKPDVSHWASDQIDQSGYLDANVLLELP